MLIFYPLTLFFKVFFAILGLFAFLLQILELGCQFLNTHAKPPGILFEII